MRVGAGSSDQGPAPACWRRAPAACLHILTGYSDACAFLIEAWSPLGGGSGRQADWQLAATVIAQARKPVLLAGGLSPATVATAFAQTGPHGVDVSSGVERDGWKDPDLIQQFVRAVRGSAQPQRGEVSC